MDALQAALSLAEEWSLPVFPCGRDKKPLTTHGFKDASLNLEQIAAWWQQWPGALVGVPTGAASKLLVVDVDPTGEAWYRTHTLKLSAGRVHKTPRGWHLLYRMPADEAFGCTVGHLSAGIDTRGEGGYIIWWPAEGLEAIGDLADVAEPPAALLDKLRKPAPVLAKTNGAEIPEGARNSSLASLAGVMRRANASPEELRVALVAFNGRCVPPLPEAEVERIAASVARYAPAERRPPKLKGVRMSKVTAHLADSYVVKGVLARDSLVGIIGGSGSGKTFFGADLAAHIAMGRPWRGHSVRPGVVVYAALEGLRSAENRIVAIREALKPDDAPLVLTGGPLNLRNYESVEALLALVRETEAESSSPCSAIFVDTLSRALAGGDENHSEDMAALVTGADALRMATGAAIVLVHHLGKDEARGARGHSLLRAALDTELTVAAHEGVHVVTVTKQRDYDLGKGYAFRLNQVLVGLDDEGEGVTTCVVDPEAELPPPELGGKNQRALDAGIREWRRTHPGACSITSAELARLADGQRIDRHRRVEVLDALVKRCLLTPCESGYLFTS